MMSEMLINYLFRSETTRKEYDRDDRNKDRGVNESNKSKNNYRNSSSLTKRKVCSGSNGITKCYC